MFIPVVLICATLNPRSVFLQTAPAILCQQTCFGCRSGAHFPHKTLSESSLFWRQRGWGRDNGQLSAANLSVAFVPENQVSLNQVPFSPGQLFLIGKVFPFHVSELAKKGSHFLISVFNLFLSLCFCPSPFCNWRTFVEFCLHNKRSEEDYGGRLQPPLVCRTASVFVQEQIAVENRPGCHCASLSQEKSQAFAPMNLAIKGPACKI